jgi:uncharacterized protein YxeA
LLKRKTVDKEGIFMKKIRILLISLMILSIITGCTEEKTAMITDKEYGKLKIGLSYTKVKKIVKGKEVSKYKGAKGTEYVFNGEGNQVYLVFNNKTNTLVCKSNEKEGECS